MRTVLPGGSDAFVAALILFSAAAPSSADQIVTEAQHAGRLPGTPRIDNYPKPFNPVTTFNLEITVQGIVSIYLYSVEGRFVTTVFSGYIEKGLKQIIWKSTGIHSGVHFARLESPEGNASRKVIILR